MSQTTTNERTEARLQFSFPDFFFGHTKNWPFIKKKRGITDFVRSPRCSREARARALGHAIRFALFAAARRECHHVCDRHQSAGAIAYINAGAIAQYF